MKRCSGCPSADWHTESASLLQGYVRELEDYMHEHLHDGSSIPEWAHKLMRDRYGMKLHG